MTGENEDPMRHPSEEDETRDDPERLVVEYDLEAPPDGVRADGHGRAPARSARDELAEIGTSRLATLAFGAGTLAFATGTMFAGGTYTAAMGVGAAATAVGLGIREVAA